jgi:CHAD domain-containing protein
VDETAGNGHGSVGARAYELSQGPDAGTPEENWLRAERELRVAHDYDTDDRDLERLGMRLSRLPSEAGVVWRLALPRGERVAAWEPGNGGLRPPLEVARLLDAVAAGKALVPAPPLHDEAGARRLREALETQRRALLAHDPGTRVGADAENLHQHRVAARRTRAFLRAAKDQLDPGWRRAVAAPLSELGRATGPVRDLDVLLDELDRGGVEALIDILGGELERARAALLEALDSESYRRLLAVLRHPPRLREGVTAVPIDGIARREFRTLVKTVDRLGKHPAQEALHGLRITLKRVRYAAELAAPEGENGRRFLAAARLLQDLLGEHQDAVVAEAHLRASTVVDERTAAAFAAGRIAERQAARRAQVRAALPAAWKRLRRTGHRLA